MDVPLLTICSSVSDHLGCFQFEAIVNNVAVNIYVYIVAWAFVFSFPVFILRSGIAGLLDNSL